MCAHARVRTFASRASARAVPCCCFFFFLPLPRGPAAAVRAPSMTLTNACVAPADEDEPEDAVSDVEEVPKSKKKKKAKKSSRESRSSKRQRPIREVSVGSLHALASLNVSFLMQKHKNMVRKIKYKCKMKRSGQTLLLNCIYILYFTFRILTKMFVFLASLFFLAAKIFL